MTAREMILGFLDEMGWSEECHFTSEDGYESGDGTALPTKEEYADALAQLLKEGTVVRAKVWRRKKDFRLVGRAWKDQAVEVKVYLLAA